MGGERRPGPLDETNQVKARQAAACHSPGPVGRFNPGYTDSPCQVRVGRFYPETLSGMERRYRQFVLDAEPYGLPTRFLRYVSVHYSIEPSATKWHQGRLQGRIAGVPQGNSTDTSRNELFLTSVIIDGVKSLNPRALGGEAEAIDTIYHESTHAFMDLMAERGDPKWSTIIKKGEAYYRDAPLETGGTAWKGEYAERVFHEAAAMYVGARARVWWEVFEALTYAAIGQVPAKGLAKWLDLERGLYNKGMAERVFGYAEIGLGDTKQIRTTKKISDELRSFLDQELLEGKIADDFDQVTGFQRLILGLKLMYSES